MATVATESVPIRVVRVGDVGGALAVTGRYQFAMTINLVMCTRAAESSSARANILDPDSESAERRAALNDHTSVRMLLDGGESP